MAPGTGIELRPRTRGTTATLKEQGMPRIDIATVPARRVLAIHRHSMCLCESNPSAPRRCRRASGLRCEPDDIAFRRLVQSAPLA